MCHQLIELHCNNIQCNAICTVLVIHFLWVIFWWPQSWCQNSSVFLFIWMSQCVLIHSICLYWYCEQLILYPTYGWNSVDLCLCWGLCHDQKVKILSPESVLGVYRFINAQPHLNSACNKLIWQRSDLIRWGMWSDCLLGFQ